jgi:hypothetical protein
VCCAGRASLTVECHIVKQTLLAQQFGDVRRLSGAPVTLLRMPGNEPKFEGCRTELLKLIL